MTDSQETAPVLQRVADVVASAGVALMIGVVGVLVVRVVAGSPPAFEREIGTMPIGGLLAGAGCVAGVTAAVLEDGR